MRDVVNIQRLEQAKVLLNPIRIRLLQMLIQPQTCPQLSEALGLSQQRLNAHLKEMLGQGLIRIARRRKVRNLIEATYQAQAKAYWFSPRILRDPAMDAAKFRDELSLNNLLILAETVQDDVGGLLDRDSDEETPSVSIAAEIYLKDESERKQFTKEVLRALTGVLEKYQGADDGASAFKATFLCYPKPVKRET